MGNRSTSFPIDLATLPGSNLLLIPRGVKEGDDGGCEEGGEKGHDDKDGKCPDAKNLGLKTNVLESMDVSTAACEIVIFLVSTYQNNKFHKTFATHQDTNGKGLSPNQAIQSSRQRRTNDLGDEGDECSGKHITPGRSSVEKAEIRAKTGEGKVKRQENGTDEIFHLLNDTNIEAVFTWNDQTDNKSSKNRMNSNNSREKGRGKGDEENKSNGALRRAILKVVSFSQHKAQARFDGHDE